MAGKRREEVTEKDLTGLKYFDRLAPLLARLHGDGLLRIATDLWDVPAAIIACTLLSLWTGRKPTLRTRRHSSRHFAPLPHVPSPAPPGRSPRVFPTEAAGAIIVPNRIGTGALFAAQ